MKNEIEVYAAFFGGDTTSTNLTVLVTSTEARNYGVDNLNLSLAAQGHGIPPELRKDFKIKNNTSCLIQPFAGVPNLRFISKREQHTINASGWSAFHEKYGKDSWAATVSRVGFNPDKTLALLHVIGASSHNGVAGTLYVLERKNGSWVVKFHIQTVAV